MGDSIIQTTLPDFARVAYYMRKSLRAGQLSNFGPANLEFTERLSQATQLSPNRRLLTTSSGHTALMTAYAALGVKRLAMPAFTFESTRAAAALQGIDVELVDVDARTGCVSPATLAQLDPDAYDGVVAVCALSTIPDLAELGSFCRARGKCLIIDGAATWGTPGGLANHGDAYCYSFHATKTLPIGEGGAVVLNAEYYERAYAYVNFGRSPERRLIVTDGRTINGKLSEYAAAVGLAVLDDLDEEISARRMNAMHYKQRLSDVIPPSWCGAATIYAFLPTFAPSRAAAVAIRGQLDAAGVPHLAYYTPVADRPVTRALYERSVCLPVHGGISADDIDRISTAFHE